MPDANEAAAEPPEQSPKADLPAEAVRALEEAALRRKERDRTAVPAAPEAGGRPGPDATRYGDWEKGGLVSDF